MEGELKQVQSSAKARGEKGSAEPSPAQPLQLPSHLVQPRRDEENPLFSQAVPLLTPALTEGGKSFVYIGTGFLKENLVSTMDLSC